MGLGWRRQRQPPQELAPDVLGRRVPRFRVQPVHQQAEGPRAQESAVFRRLLGPAPGPAHGVQGFLYLLQKISSYRHRRDNTGRVTGVDTCLLHVFHNSAYIHILSIADGINVNLNSVFKKLVHK